MHAGDRAGTLHLAERMGRLGAETAFAVSAEAAEFLRRGRRVYPFHLGDLDLKTPENIIAATEKAMRDGRTGYCSNYGIPELRELLAADIREGLTAFKRWVES